jgi:hypothetical protein
MLDEEAALRCAADFLAARSILWPASNVRLIPESAFVDGIHLVVAYNSVAFLDEGEEGAELGGNMPVRVDLEIGECQFISMIDFLDYMDRGFIE